MLPGPTIGLVAVAMMSQAVVVDRITVVVAQRPVKTSDIEVEARLQQFLNGDPLAIESAARRQAAERLIDQALIRREIELGRYPSARPEDVERLREDIKRQRFKTDAAYHQALAGHGITESQLTGRLAWQLTVLNFIERRFRPGVLVTDSEVERYCRQHYPAGVPLETVRSKIEDQIAGERVNELFERWLAETRTQLKPQYIEGALE